MRPGLIAAFAVGVIAASAANAAPDTAPPGFSVKADGTLVHRASGSAFPEHVAGFTRTADRAFDPNGHDIAITYRDQVNGKPIVARVTLIHIVGMTPHEHFLGMRSAAATYFPKLDLTNVVPAGDGPFTPPGLGAMSGWQGRFRARQGKEAYDLSLSTLKLGYWSARLTAAYPSAIAPDASGRITQLASALLASGPKHPARRG